MIAERALSSGGVNGPRNLIHAILVTSFNSYVLDTKLLPICSELEIQQRPDGVVAVGEEENLTM